MLKKVVTSDSPVVLKTTKGKPRGLPSPEELATEELATRDDAIFRARLKLREWLGPLLGMCQYDWLNLVTPFDSGDESIFEPDEFALVPTRDLENYRESFNEAREYLDHMEQQWAEAFAARRAEYE